MKYIIYLGLIAYSFNIKGQFVSTFVSFPDSARVTMNEEVKCYTPCKVKYFWRENDNGLISFKVDHEGYKTYEVSITEKPMEFNDYENVTLELYHENLELANTPLIAFDKVRVELNDGQKIGVKKMLNKPTKLIEWSGSIKVGDQNFEKAFYTISTDMGFNNIVSENSQLFSVNTNENMQLPRYIVGAEIKSITLDYEETEEKSYGVGKMKGKTILNIDWHVLDKKNEKVVLTVNNQSVIRFRQNSYQDLTYILDAYKLGLISFLKNAKFLALVTSDEATYFDEDIEIEEKKVLELQKIILPQFSNESDMISQIKDACITIRTDGGHGSGSIISKDGFILTAYHVVEGVNKIDIHFASGLKLPAELYAYDKSNDVAILKIPGDGYTALPLYTGKDFSLGTNVVTIGTPYSVELGQSISKGILSGKRENEGQVYLQLNMAVSPGNSGGPLLNDQGEILGVIQRKIVGSGIEGIGFAIPSNELIKELNLKIAD